MKRLILSLILFLASASLALAAAPTTTVSDLRISNQPNRTCLGTDLNGLVGLGTCSGGGGAGSFNASGTQGGVLFLNGLTHGTTSAAFTINTSSLQLSAASATFSGPVLLNADSLVGDTIKLCFGSSCSDSSGGYITENSGLRIHLGATTLILQDSSFHNATLDLSALTGNHTYGLPDLGGTFCLTTTCITSLTNISSTNETLSGYLQVQTLYDNNGNKYSTSTGGGSLSGTGTSTDIAFWDGTNSITADDALTFVSSSGVFTAPIIHIGGLGKAYLDASLLSGDRIFQFPDEAGQFVTQDGTGYVDSIVILQDGDAKLDLHSNDGTYHGVLVQSPSSTNALIILGQDNNTGIAALDTSLLTGHKQFTFPDTSGTLCLTTTCTGGGGATTTITLSTTTYNGPAFTFATSTSAGTFNIRGLGSTFTFTIPPAGDQYFAPSTTIPTVFVTNNLGNWAGTWQGVNSSTFYLASNPAGYSSSTLTASGTIIQINANGSNYTLGVSPNISQFTNNSGYITTSTYNASMTIATAAPLGGGGSLTNGGTLNLTCTGCLTAFNITTSSDGVIGQALVWTAHNQVAPTSSQLVSGATSPVTISAQGLIACATCLTTSTWNVNASGTNLFTLNSNGSTTVWVNSNPTFNNVSSSNLTASGFLQAKNVFDTSGNKFVTSTPTFNTGVQTTTVFTATRIPFIQDTNTLSASSSLEITASTTLTFRFGLLDASNSQMRVNSSTIPNLYDASGIKYVTSTSAGSGTLSTSSVVTTNMFAYFTSGSTLGSTSTPVLSIAASGTLTQIGALSSNGALTIGISPNLADYTNNANFITAATAPKGIATTSALSAGDIPFLQDVNTISGSSSLTFASSGISFNNGSTTNLQVRGYLSMLGNAVSSTNFFFLDNPQATTTYALMQIGSSTIPGNTNGTYLAINTPAAFSGDFLNFFTQSSTKFSVSGGGVASATQLYSASTSLQNIVSALVLTDAKGGVSGYTGASGCAAGSAITALSALGATTCAAFGSSNVSTSTANTWTALQTFSGGISGNASSTNIDVTGYIKINGDKVSTSTVATLAGAFLDGTGSALTVSSTLASSSVSFNIYDATSTSPYQYSKWGANTSLTIKQVTCDEQATGATTTLSVYLANTLATLASTTNVMSGMNCGVSGTTNGVSVAVTAGQFIVVKVTAIAGTPQFTSVNLSYTKQ
jgi:hypothetical protein